MASDSTPTYGGQALVEGVLIRTSERWAMALRQPDGQLYQADGDIAPPAGPWTLPFLRGLRALGVQLRIGTRALLDSSVMADRGEVRPLPALGLALTLVASLVIALSIFTALPLLLTGREPAIEATLAQRLSEGTVKAAFLALYVVGITRVPRYRRIFSYHGAEHMAIACAEDGQPLTVENVSRYSPAHPRCGTGFLVILAGVDTFVLAILPRFGELVDLALRIGFVPVTAAVAYELLRWGSRQRGIGFALNRFGLLSQRLTTARPDREQIEVAISALQLCRSGDGVPETPVAARALTALQ